VGVPRNHFYDDLAADVETAVRAAVDVLVDGGADVVETTFPAPDEILGTHAAIDLAEIAANHRRLYLEHADQYLPETRPFIEGGLFVRVTTYIDALRARPGLLARVLDSMRDVDVLAVPSQPIVAPFVGEATASVDGHEEDLLYAMVRLLAQFNLTGMPALSVPCGYDRSGLPIGLQIVGKPYEDGTVLRAGHAYQAATSWLERLPAPCLAAGPE
jgi:aspartyl-tRNA(Asn)/glutamyl-tRNA(Gln) amidotransferase subunit A